MSTPKHPKNVNIHVGNGHVVLEFEHEEIPSVALNVHSARVMAGTIQGETSENEKKLSNREQ